MLVARKEKGQGLLEYAMICKTKDKTIFLPSLTFAANGFSIITGILLLINSLASAG